MLISLTYILIAAEIILILLGLSLTLAVILFRKTKDTTDKSQNTEEQNQKEIAVIDLSLNYIDYLEQAVERNSVKLKQQKNNENTDLSEATQTTDAPSNNPAEVTNKSPVPDKKQSRLLLAREQFLLLEKEAAEKAEHEIHFWDHIYDGMLRIVEEFSSSETITRNPGAGTSASADKAQSKEKVFYIETQGKKVDGEVNKLKDILYDQENELSSLKKALQNAETELPDDSESLAALKEHINNMERQLNDTKMCMDILEMENSRLQEEVDNIDARHHALFEDATNTSPADEHVTDDALNSQISALEEELIKKDVAYAKLQEEFDSMETEYLAMYASVHGDVDGDG